VSDRPSARPGLDSDRPSARSGLDAFDWILFTLGLLAAFSLGVGTFVWVPTFTAMHRDFGSHASLPLITRVAASPWLLAGVAVVAAGLSVVGLLRGRRGSRGSRLLLGAGLVVSLATAMLVVGAMYAPIFQLAGNIRE